MAEVAHSGDYNDLTNKPSILTTDDVDDRIENFGGTLADVAISGHYSDLINKPDIPVVYNGTLTIQKNGTTIKTFTANSSSDVTANITVPTQLSELNNDVGLPTSIEVSDMIGDAVDGLAAVAKSGSYTDLSNKPTIPTNNNQLTNGAGYQTSSQVNSAVSDAIDNFSGTLHAVASSGNYNDLIGKPTIPTVNNGTLTIQKNGTKVAEFTANSASGVTANITVPTKFSDLNNDTGLPSSTDVFKVLIPFVNSVLPILN